MGMGNLAAIFRFWLLHIVLGLRRLVISSKRRYQEERRRNSFLAPSLDCSWLEHQQPSYKSVTRKPYMFNEHSDTWKTNWNDAICHTPKCNVTHSNQLNIKNIMPNAHSLMRKKKKKYMACYLK